MRVANRSDTFDSSADYTSAAFGLDHMTGFAVSLRFEGTSEGSLKLQCSNNAFMDNTTLIANADAIWDDVTGSTMAIDAATDATATYNVADAYYNAFRYVYTAAAGGGTTEAKIYGKGPQS